MNGSQPALNALNFFMADVEAGLGPFLGVYLQSKHWSPAEIGLVMTIGALVGMAATAPLGALVDRIKAKRAMVAVSAVITVLASMAILFMPGFVPTAIAQGVNGVADAAIGPAIAGITLGLVGQKGYAHQVGRNEAFNHGGNVTAAVLAGVLGYAFGLGAVFVVMAVMAAASLVAAWFIDPKKIDHRAARGLPDKADDGHASGWSALLASKPLLALAATLLLFHLGNAAMLPLLGQELAAKGGDPSAYTSATIVVAQLTMVPMAILAARLAEARGYWIVFLLALLALPIRGSIAAVVTGPIGLGPVQMLDGVGAGLLGVAVPGLVARILSGTGHINAGLGAVMTMQGIGAALSPALGGYVAQRLGYPASFMVLGAVAVVALALWVVTRPLTAQYAGHPD
jgi:predicted MFS family arabinose efflux permease